MEKFCKVFEMEDGGQLLVSKIISEEDNEYPIALTTMQNGMELTLKVTLDNEQSQKSALDEYSQEKANEVYANILNIFNQQDN